MLGSILLTTGIVLFTPWISVGVLIKFLAVVVLGAGVGLIFVGIYLLSKKDKFGGAIDIIIGAVAITLSVLYITVPEFNRAFWIIIGCVIAVYGVLDIASAFIDKK